MAFKDYIRSSAARDLVVRCLSGDAEIRRAGAESLSSVLIPGDCASAVVGLAKSSDPLVRRASCLAGYQMAVGH